MVTAPAPHLVFAAGPRPSDSPSFPWSSPRGALVLALDPASASLVLTGTTMLSAALGLIVLLTGGESPAATWTQVVFTAVFGLVAAQLVVLTDSLWPVIAWHALWDFTNTVGGNLSTPEALTGIGAAVVVLIMYSLVLGRRISAGAASGARR